MLFDFLHLLLSLPVSLLGGALLLRVYAQRIKLHPHNPLSQFLFKLTDWLVKPLRRLIPGVGGVDWASLCGAWALAVCLLAVLALLRSILAGSGLALFPSPLNLALLGLLKIAQWGISTALLFVFVAALMSWFQLQSPLAYVIRELVAPLLRPIQRRLPTNGMGLDMSPMVLVFILLIVQHGCMLGELYLTPIGTIVR
ncbi:YggT family protein [Parvibium lacunae]|uniref:YggT family protein n=2 Tax=Parvibium lacunae TaxID=1888893 RepID=A0A368L2E5_9BURK|nr:YggT family protein [Parvibium lacunae]